MTEDSETVRQPTGDYEVGYCRPPAQYRFARGKSGNRAGRPKGTKNLKTDLLEEMQEQILVREGSREKKISKQRAMLKSVAAQAIKGNTRATSVVLGLLYRLTHADGNNEPTVDLSDEDLAIIEGFTKRVTARPRSTSVSESNSGAANQEPGGDLRPNNPDNKVNQ